MFVISVLFIRVVFQSHVDFVEKLFKKCFSIVNYVQSSTEQTACFIVIIVVIRFVAFLKNYSGRNPKKYLRKCVSVGQTQHCIQSQCGRLLHHFQRASVKFCRRTPCKTSQDEQCRLRLFLLYICRYSKRTIIILVCNL